MTIFTDGFSEAMNSKREKFFLRKVRSQDGRELLDLIDRELRAVPAAVPQQPATAKRQTQ